MKLQILSGINSQFKVKVDCDYLFLTGNINTEEKNEFFNYCSNNFKHIFYVPESQEELPSKYKNIHLLLNNYFILENYIVIGTILLSQNDYDYLFKIVNYLNNELPSKKIILITHFPPLNIEKLDISKIILWIYSNIFNDFNSLQFPFKMLTNNDINNCVFEI